MVAPADAVVLEVAKLSQGSIVREAEAFFTLVPLGTVLEADVQIGSQDIGYVKSQAKVNIKVDAYPFQKHGTLEGSLRTISQDAFRVAKPVDATYCHESYPKIVVTIAPSKSTLKRRRTFLALLHLRRRFGSA